MNRWILRTLVCREVDFRYYTLMRSRSISKCVRYVIYVEQKLVDGVRQIAHRHVRPTVIGAVRSEMDRRQCVTTGQRI